MKIDLNIMAKAAASVLRPTDAAAIARKALPTQDVSGLVRAAGGVQKALRTGAPVTATADVMSHLMQAPGAALGFAGKYAGIADRDYMYEGTRRAAQGGQRAAQGAKSIFDKVKAQVTPENAMNYGLPGVFGALAGAEQVPENRLLGAVGGGGGAMGGSFLGAAAARNMGGERIGQYIGRLIGASMGQDVGVRGARLLAT